tara:strand:+ start:108 stop:3104 length:2997 start_codon:yes stop_codon:yes gene_type:complete
MQPEGDVSDLQPQEDLLEQRGSVRDVDIREEAITKNLRDGIDVNSERFNHWRDGADDPAYRAPANNKYDLERPGDGDPIILFHGTTRMPQGALGDLGDELGVRDVEQKDFTSLKLPDREMGIHVGTLAQSDSFAPSGGGPAFPITGPFLGMPARKFPVVIRGNFLRVPDQGMWTSGEVVNALYDSGKFTEKQIAEVGSLTRLAGKEEGGLPSNARSAKERKALNGWLNEKGITGLVYRNNREGAAFNTDYVHMIDEIGEMSDGNMRSVLRNMDNSSSKKSLLEKVDGSSNELHLHLKRHLGDLRIKSAEKESMPFRLWQGYQRHNGAPDNYQLFLDNFTTSQDSYMLLREGDVKSVFNAGTFNPKDRDLLMQSINELGPIGQKLLDTFDLADVDDEVGFILPDGRKIAYDNDFTHDGMIERAMGDTPPRYGEGIKAALDEGVVRVSGPGQYQLTGTPSRQQIREMTREAEDGGSVIIDFGRPPDGSFQMNKVFESTAEMQRFFALKQTSLGKKKPRGIIKGAIDLTDEANAIIHLSKHADVSTMIHELGHLWRRGLNTKDAKIIENWIGSSFKNWNVSNEETFARGLEKYVREGIAPDESLGDLFDRAKVMMENIYATLRGSPLSDRAMPQETKDVFGRLFYDGSLELDEPTMKAMNTSPRVRNPKDALRVAADWAQGNLGVDSYHIKASRNIGDAVENTSRITHFFSKLASAMKAGGSLDESAIIARDSVDTYLFNYSRGLTEFERNKVRPFIPFYSWMRFNIPLQVQAIFEDPARYSKIPKLIGSIESMTKDWQGIEAPDYTRDLHAVRLPWLINSKPVLVNPNLPFQDLNKTPLVGFPDILQNLTPFIRVLGEVVPERGYSTFFKRPIEKYGGERADDLHLPFLPDVGIGVSKKTEHAIQSLFPTVGKISRLNRKMSQGEATTQLASEMLGVKLISVDTQSTIRGETFAKRTALRDLKKRLEEEHQIHINTKARKKTTRRGKRKKKARPKFGDTF